VLSARLTMQFPAYLILPALAAVVYAVSALCQKRGYAQGADVRQTFHWANLISMPFFAPLFFVSPLHPEVMDWWRAALVAGLIYCGNLCMFAATRRGDVSMVTPVLGTKVIFVALGVLAISGQSLSTGLWIAAALAMLGIVVMSRSDMQHGKANGAAIGLCLLSAVFFGLTDVLIAQWVPRFGGNLFLGAIPQFVGLFSLVAVLRPGSPGIRLVSGSRRWVVGSSVLLAGQGMAMGVALAFFNDPAGVNILYSTRGLWSVILVWCIGRWFGNRERYTAGRSAMLWRLAGALLITAGVVVAVLERSRP
jgi:drug/metabolite transporter (DMT)-like permease